MTKSDSLCVRGAETRWTDISAPVPWLLHVNPAAVHGFCARTLYCSGAKAIAHLILELARYTRPSIKCRLPNNTPRLPSDSCFTSNYGFRLRGSNLEPRTEFANYLIFYFTKGHTGRPTLVDSEEKCLLRARIQSLPHCQPQFIYNTLRCLGGVSDSCSLQQSIRTLPSRST